MWWFQLISLRAIFSTKGVGPFDKVFRQHMGIEFVCSTKCCFLRCIISTIRQHVCYVCLVIVLAFDQFRSLTIGFSQNDFLHLVERFVRRFGAALWRGFGWVIALSAQSGSKSVSQ